MNVPANLLYSESHEWVEKTSETTAKVGLTDYAQSHLGDLVFVNLPMEGDTLSIGESFGDVESVKAVSDVNAPVDGVVSAINEDLLDSPADINKNPYEAWFIEVSEITSFDGLMDAAAYEEFCKNQD